MANTFTFEDVIQLLFTNYVVAPPYIKLHETIANAYSLVGQSDLATGQLQNYIGIGTGKLTAFNHSLTLEKLMRFMIIYNEIDEIGEVDFRNEKQIKYFEEQLKDVLDCFFRYEKEFEYSNDLMADFIFNNKQLINEALYNLTKDNDIKQVTPYADKIDSLDGVQFIDPYINMAHEIAKIYKKRPYEVISEWSTSELIVTYAKLLNDNSLNSFLNYKYSQKNAPKQEPPKKQVFYFDDIDVDFDPKEVDKNE